MASGRARIAARPPPPRLPLRAASGTVEEVVVTARSGPRTSRTCRSRSWRSPPKAMEAKGVQDATDLSAWCRTCAGRTAQQTGVAIRIRGMGAASNAAIDPSVAPYIDGASSRVRRGPADLPRRRERRRCCVVRRAPCSAVTPRRHLGEDLRAEPGRDYRLSGDQAGSYGERQSTAWSTCRSTKSSAVRRSGQFDRRLRREQLDGNLRPEGPVEGRVSAKWKPTDDSPGTQPVRLRPPVRRRREPDQVDTSTGLTAQLAAFAVARRAIRRRSAIRRASRPTNSTRTSPQRHPVGIASDLSYQFAGATPSPDRFLPRLEERAGDGDVLFTRWIC